MVELSENALNILKDRYFWENENTWVELCERQCRENVKNERNEQKKWEDEFMSILEPMLFIPAGRILRNLGKLKPATSNCNFLPIEDNIESIFETLAHYGVISSYGGGNGINFSSLRPEGVSLVTKGGVSSGMVSFIDMFNYCGAKLQTGGQRRAAGIGICNISHPEVIKFIDAKIKHDELKQFNISVGIDSNFLKAVQKDDNWELKFAGKVYNTVKAKDLWYKVLQNMIDHAEPGFINWDNMKKNNSFYFSPIHGVNPCGELPLGDYETCNLGAIVLSKFIVNTNTNWQKLRETLRIALRFMDNIIDLAYYPIQQQDTAVKNARRVGIGTMGLSDYLFQKQIRYGSEKSIFEIEKLYKFIRDELYIASVDLAKEKGAFPKFDKIEYGSASFIRKLPPKIRMYIKDNSIRNCTLLTAAPTGTTSMIPGVNGGIEPLPFKGYIRKDGMGERIFVHELCKESYNEEWFVDSYDLKPEEHLEVQATIQKYIDGGVSKTIILPKIATVEDLDKILMEYIFDLKGVTVYRDESRKEQVYYKLSKKEIEKYLKENKTTSVMTEEDVQCAKGTCEV